GRRAFPLHTDDAVADRPARYVLLFNETNGHLAATTLLDGRALLKGLPDGIVREAEEAVFYFRNGRGSFLGVVYDRRQKTVRFDPNIMRATGRRAETLLAAHEVWVGNAPIIRHRWQPVEVLIIDNHRFLHGREFVAMPEAGPPRTLLRILIEDPSDA